MTPRGLKVGELAARTGVSVRTLHHYEAIGLLVPSHRTASNHRRYTASDVARLQRIMSLRQLGLGLTQVAAMLADANVSPLSIVVDHLAHVREEVAMRTLVIARLVALESVLRRGDEADVDLFLNAIEGMTMWESKFTDAQKDEIRARGRALGTEAVRGIETEWVTLLAAVRAAMENGTDATSPETQALVRRLRETTRAFSAGDAAIEGTLTEAYRQGAGAAFGVDAALTAYIERASRA